MRGFDKHMGVVLASVCLCVSSSARAVSCILHAHREWRMTGESTQQEEGYADCNFRHGIFFSLVKKKVGGGVINKRCNLLQGTDSHWRMRA